MVASFAPPWRGPLSAPIAPVTAEWMSARVAAMTRAAKVLALSSWSAWRMSAIWKARGGVWGGLSPLSTRRNLGGGEGEGFADVGVVAAVGFVGVVDAEERDGGAKDLHGRGVGGDAAEKVEDFWIEGARGREVTGELG